MSGVTQILTAIGQGNPAAAEQLLPLVYDELRRLAAQRLEQERPGQTLQATALVHEAYVRLVEDQSHQQWDHRGHFFAAAAEAMRRILVDAARRRRSAKRGGDRQRVPLNDDELVAFEIPDNLLDVDEALTRLQAIDPRAAELVQLRYFAGLTVAEAAHVLSISVATAENDWAYAKSWLKLRMSDSAGR